MDQLRRAGEAWRRDQQGGSPYVLPGRQRPARHQLVEAPERVGAPLLVILLPVVIARAQSRRLLGGKPVERGEEVTQRPANGRSIEPRQGGVVEILGDGAGQPAIADEAVRIGSERLSDVLEARHCHRQARREER